MPWVPQPPGANPWTPDAAGAPAWTPGPAPGTERPDTLFLDGSFLLNGRQILDGVKRTWLPT